MAVADLAELGADRAPGGAGARLGEPHDHQGGDELMSDQITSNDHLQHWALPTSCGTPVTHRRSFLSTDRTDPTDRPGGSGFQPALTQIASGRHTLSEALLTV